MACKGHGLGTKTTAVEDDGFESFEKARKALLKELMSQVKQDRKQNGESCGDHDCAAEKRCATIMFYRVNSIDVAIYSYDDEDDDLAYGYEWNGGQIQSACRCVRKKKKPKK